MEKNLSNIKWCHSIFLAECAQNPVLKPFFGKYMDIEGKRIRQKGGKNCLEAIQRSLPLNETVVKSQSALCTWESLIHPLNEGQRETKKSLVMMDLSNTGRHLRKAM